MFRISSKLDFRDFCWFSPKKSERVKTEKDEESLSYYRCRLKRQKYHVLEDYVAVRKLLLLSLMKRAWRHAYSRENRRRHPETGRKQQAKRRALDYIELNEPFPGSEGHHIDKEFVIHIPKKMHRSISHNVFTGKNMDKINDLAIDFCYGD